MYAKRSAVSLPKALTYCSLTCTCPTRVMVSPSSAPCAPPTQSVASILEHDLDATIQDWMELVKHDQELTCIPLSFEDRTGHLPHLLAELIYRLRLPPISKASISIPARQH